MRSYFSKNWQTILYVLIAAGLILLALSGYLSTLINTAGRPVVSAQAWVSTRFNAVYEFLTVPRDVATLRQQNAELEDEVASLQRQVVELQQQLRESQVLYALLDFARKQPENEYVAAAVIGKDPSPFLHYIIIDHGSDDGLRHGMPVVTQQGLVGRVDATTATAARVELITDANSKVNITFQSLDEDGLLVGSLTGDISVEMISQDVQLQTGELVLTSGLGGDYPSDVVVGQAVSIRKLETELFQSASIQPAVDFSNLSAVLVITNFRPIETDILIPPTQ